MVSSHSPLTVLWQVLQVTIQATQWTALSCPQLIKSNLSQFSPMVPPTPQPKLLLQFQTTTPTAAASPVHPATTEMVLWSLCWTTETQQQHTKGRPRDAGRRQSRWAKVRWSHPERRRTEVMFNNRRWIGVKKNSPYLSSYRQRWWGRWAPLSLWAQCLLRAKTPSLIRSLKITPWRTQPTKQQLVSPSLQPSMYWLPAKLIPKYHSSIKSYENIFYPSSLFLFWRPTDKILPRIFLFLFVLKEKKSPVIFFYARDIYIF